MIRNNPDIAAVAVLTLALAVCPVFTINVRPDAPEPRVVRITERLELGSSRMERISEIAARKIELLRERAELECLKQKLHE